MRDAVVRHGARERHTKWRLAYVHDFIEDAKSGGLVKRTIEAAGLRVFRCTSWKQACAIEMRANHTIDRDAPESGARPVNERFKCQRTS